MLLRFSLQNMFSFRDRQVLDLTPCSDCTHRMVENVLEVSGERALASVAVYGANACGKSNLFFALRSFLYSVIYSFDEMYQDKMRPILPFFHDEAYVSKPMSGEIELLVRGRCYKYGYDILDGKIKKEWLFRKDDGAYQVLFLRQTLEDKDVIDVRKENFPDVNDLIVGNTRDSALFLSTCAKMSVSEAKDILDELHDNINVVSAEGHHSAYTADQMYRNPDFYSSVSHFLAETDPSLGKILIKPKYEASGKFTPSGHSILSGNYEVNVVPRDAPAEFETQGGIPFGVVASSGTKKAFDLAGPVFDALKSGKTLFVDEFGMVMHPILTREILRLFNSPKTNPKKAQLIFNTHDTNLLNAKVYSPERKIREPLLRPDQIYFIERGPDHSSHMYSKADYAPTANEEGLTNEDEYLDGRYGAIPYIGSLMGDVR